MRTWLLRHPHVPLLLATAYWVLLVHLTVDYFSDSRWGWGIVLAVIQLDAFSVMRKWWRRT